MTATYRIYPKDPRINYYQVTASSYQAAAEVIYPDIGVSVCRVNGIRRIKDPDGTVIARISMMTD